MDPELILIVSVTVIAVVASVIVAWRVGRYARRNWPRRPRPAQASVSSPLRLFGALAIVVISGALCALLAPNPLGLFAWASLLVIVAMGINRRRLTDRKALLRLIAAAVDSGLPLHEAVAAFGQEIGGRVGREARKLAELLAAGMPLPEALLAVPRLTSRRTRTLIWLGHQSGTLRQSLAEAGREHEHAGPFSQWIGHLVAVGGLGLVAVAIVSFIMLKIVPAFRQIFDDFDTELPAITQLLISLCDLVASYLFVALPLLLILLLLFFYGVLRYMGAIEWNLPLAQRFHLPLDMAVVLRGLAVLVESGRPLGQAVATVAQSFPGELIYTRLAGVGRDVAAGRDWRQSLLDHQLLDRRDAAVLQAAQAAGNLPWALRLVADNNEQRLAWRLRGLLELFAPPLWLAFGMLVGFIVVALFMPLIKIIDTLT